MSKSIMAIIALGMVTLVAACAQQDEPVVVPVEPVMEEPTYNKM